MLTGQSASTTKANGPSLLLPGSDAGRRRHGTITPSQMIALRRIAFLRPSLRKCERIIQQVARARGIMASAKNAGLK